jgi:hypothetical protein
MRHAEVKNADGGRVQEAFSRASKCEGACKSESEEMVETTDGRCPDGCAHVFGDASKEAQKQARLDWLLPEEAWELNCLYSGGKYSQTVPTCEEIKDEEGKVNCEFRAKTQYKGGTCGERL